MRPAAVLRLIALLAPAACAGGQTPAGTARFHNRPPVEVVNDRRPVPRRPARNRHYRRLNRYDSHFQRRLTRWMEMRPQRRAASVNSIDEVPDSTWFTNRIGVRDLSVDEIRRGPNLSGSPEEHRPWVIKSSKSHGVAVGFIVEDARGFKYILKFDGEEYPEAETAADAVVQRLLWAAGYNVPENYVVRFRREDLLLSAESVIEDRLGNEKPMSEAFVARQLSRIAVEEDGSLRGLASKYLDGEPVGGHLRDGVRPDDPNDRVPHELRRELRGAYPLFAWVDHADAKVDNTLDMYVRDPVDPEVRYLVHYLVDFGKSLGAYGLTSRYKAQGRAYIYDFHDMALSLVTVGLWRRPWEGREWPRHLRGVGIFESRTFHPGRWKPATPGYFPFLDLDRFDGFWGAKIVARFTPEHIRAAVEQGRYSDPRAIDYITRTLLERQRMTVRYWFARVAPLDRFAVVAGAGGERLCFEDLALRYRLSGSAPAASRYRARAYDRDGRETGWRAVGAGTRHGRACLPPLRAAPGRDGYTIVRIETDRPGHDLPAVLVHLAREPRRGALRVIGLRRL